MGTVNPNDPPEVQAAALRPPDPEPDPSLAPEPEAKPKRGKGKADEADETGGDA